MPRSTRWYRIILSDFRFDTFKWKIVLHCTHQTNDNIVRGVFTRILFGVQQVLFAWIGKCLQNTTTVAGKFWISARPQMATIVVLWKLQGRLSSKIDSETPIVAELFFRLLQNRNKILVDRFRNSFGKDATLENPNRICGRSVKCLGRGARASRVVFRK